MEFNYNMHACSMGMGLLHAPSPIHHQIEEKNIRREGEKEESESTLSSLRKSKMTKGPMFRLLSIMIDP